jgi:phosphomannomutase
MIIEMAYHETRSIQSTLPGSLRSALDYEPQILRFGTSGRRGEVVHLTQLEVYINALAELRYLQSLPPAEGGIVPGDDFYFAYDLRPSSTSFVEEANGRGEIAQAIVQAISDAGMKPVNAGDLPTPALTSFAVSRGKGSIMVTGSHIPFDRNGYKTNTSRGELLKQHEAPIGAKVEEIRAAVYARPLEQSLFNERGLFKSGHSELPPVIGSARSAYIARYADFFRGSSLKGMRLVFYQHSSVGRDLVPEILRQLGAEVIVAGRSDTFVPIDTENIDAAQMAIIQRLADAAIARHGHIDAVVSTDGDSDRPLVLGVDRSTGKVHFFGGDLLGMVVAEFLGADAVVVPISCNDAIDRGALASVLQPKTKIGSPFVIAGMEKALAAGKKAVCGWEANGGFLTGSNFERDGKTLAALPTRDAVLPILGVLFSASAKGLSLIELFDRLPRRFSRAALLKNFPRPVGLEIVKRFSPADRSIEEIHFDKGQPSGEAEAIRKNLERFFNSKRGFSTIAKLNYIDGVRMTFANGEVAHLRPSGNADEFRIYAVADTLARVEEITAQGIAEPDGILREIEAACAAAQ